MSIQLSISGDGMDFQKDITMLQAGKVIAFFGSETDQLTSIMPAVQAPDFTASPAPSITGRLSLRELLNSANAKTNAQKITVFGEYLSSQSEGESFDSKDVKALFVKTREPVPKKFKRDFDVAIKSGYIEEVPGDKNKYFVTRYGEESIEAGFSTANKRSKGSSKSRTSPPPRKSASAVSDKVKAIEPITPVLEGYPNYHQLPTKGAKVLWILAFAESHSIEHLPARDISYIANRLRDQIESSDMNGLTITAARNGQIARVAGSDYRLLHDGHVYLKKLVKNDKSN